MLLKSAEGRGRSVVILPPCRRESLPPPPPKEPSKNEGLVIRIGPRSFVEPPSGKKGKGKGGGGKGKGCKSEIAMLVELFVGPPKKGGGKEKGKGGKGAPPGPKKGPPGEDEEVRKQWH